MYELEHLLAEEEPKKSKPTVHDVVNQLTEGGRIRNFVTVRTVPKKSD